MDPSQKISVLLAEYNTLREEVLAARGNIAQAVGLWVPVIAGIVGASFSKQLTLHRRNIIRIIAISAVIYLGASLIWNEINTRNFTTQLRVLEGRINELAGEPLLTWETRHGWGGMGFMDHPDHSPRPRLLPQSN
jgi:hypothetical protein